MPQSVAGESETEIRSKLNEKRKKEAEARKQKESAKRARKNERNKEKAKAKRKREKEDAANRARDEEEAERLRKIREERERRIAEIDRVERLRGIKHNYSYHWRYTWSTRQTFILECTRCKGVREANFGHVWKGFQFPEKKRYKPTKYAGRQVLPPGLRCGHAESTPYYCGKSWESIILRRKKGFAVPLGGAGEIIGTTFY